MSDEPMMKMSRISRILPGEMARYLVIIRATMSVPPELPPCEKVSEMPSAESIPPMMTLSSLPLSRAMIWMNSCGMIIGRNRSSSVVTTIA